MSGILRLAMCFILLALCSCASIKVTYRVHEAPPGYVGELWRIETDQYTRDIRFSPDGRYIATAETYVARVCEVESGRQVSQFSGHGDLFWHFRHILFLPPYAQFFWLNAGVEARAGYIRAVVFAPDSKRVASAGDDGTIRIWEVQSGRQTRMLGPFDGCGFQAVAWSRDGRLIAAARLRNICFWNIESGAEWEIENAHDREVDALEFTRDGRLISAGGNICIWNAEPPTVVDRFALGTRVTSIELSHDETRLLVGLNERSVAVLDAATGERLSFYSPESDVKLRADHAWGLRANPAWLPNDRYAVVGLSAWQRDALALVDLGGGMVVRLIDGHDSPLRLVVSPDGRLAATASLEDGVRVWMLPRCIKADR